MVRSLQREAAAQVIDEPRDALRLPRTDADVDVNTRSRTRGHRRLRSILTF